MATAITVNPCLYCGGKAKITEVRRGNLRREGSNFQGLCNTCKARGPLVQDDKAEAARRWNEPARTATPTP